MSNEQTIYEESFFNNQNIPYCVKAGMVAVLNGLTIDIKKNTFGQDVFGANKFENNKLVSGSMWFTLGSPESMGANNCLASLKSLRIDESIYEGILEGKMKSDSEICEKIAESVSSSVNLNGNGTKERWNKMISVNFDRYVKACQNNYNGLLSENLVNTLKAEAANAFTKKKTMTEQMGQA